ncbi:hypothetical protein GKQ38_05495 [Candidatus Nanohaloarchaea archaeon]|nr:hypothetical protein GKQ38_05495 [Candidatus Nanohaloarchaea archaeon]
MAEIVDNSLEELDLVNVDVGEYRVTNDKTLTVDGLGTCMGIAAYDPKTRESYLLHASTWENEDLERQIEEFVDEISEIGRPYEVLAAGTMDSKYNPLTDEEFAEEARSIAENILEEREVPFETAWNNEPVYNRLTVSPEYGILYDRPEEFITDIETE